MCGIFFSSSLETLRRPQCLESLKSQNDSSDYIIELSELEIQPIIQKHIDTQTEVTDQIQKKLDNVLKLRELQELLNASKNARNADLVAEIEQKMAQLTVEDEQLKEKIDEHIIDKIIPEILARGPNYAQYRELDKAGTNFQLFSSVLSLRQPFTKQPIMKKDFIIQFNGELYNDECVNTNDTQFISELLDLALELETSRSSAITSTIAQLDGEFAIVITDLKEGVVYFGKDVIGKRSLLYVIDKNNGVTISSVLPLESAIECTSEAIHVYTIDSGNHTEVPYSELWSDRKVNHKLSLSPLAGSLEISDTHISDQVRELSAILTQATMSRQLTIHPLHPNNEHLDLGILFSGGLDCTVVAGLIAKNYVAIGKSAVVDLLTVGFENPRTGLSARESPDRKLSERSWFELCKNFQNSNVKFQLVQVDVSYQDWLAHKQRVMDLISPRATEMDLSIAIAFYFACRAQDCEVWEMKESIGNISWLQFEANPKAFIVFKRNYTSDAKVLFSGLGADELFGGYSRHEGIFNSIVQTSTATEILDKYAELSESLIGDVKIIYERNLGRDDRAMASWGKELRYPFLDNLVINHVVNEIEPELKIKFSWEKVKTKKGEKTVKVFTRKYILRCLAQELGLEMAAKEMKRAIQFGAKSAKLEIGKSKAKGTDTL